MDISNLLNQTLAAISQNLSLDDLSYASLLSDTWKERAKSCRTSLHTCLNFKNKYLQFLSEQENEDYITISREMDNIDLIHVALGEINKILLDYENLPLPASETVKITNYELFVYNQFMNEENRKILLDEIDEEDRKIKLINELMADVDTMWDNNDSEQAIKTHVYQKCKEIYRDREDEELRNISEDFFHYVTRGKAVRVALSATEIDNLTKEFYRNEGNETCGTCLEEFENNELTNVLSCSHRFHPNCIIPWLKRSVFCPTCRKDQREH